MTLATLNYGNFERPREKIQLPKASDPVGELMALYNQWEPLAQRIDEKWGGREFYDIEPSEEFYGEAAALLSGNKALLDEIGDQELGVFAAALLAIGTYSWAGYFVSAAHNLSRAKQLAGVFPGIDDLGYRLYPGKELIIAGHGSSVGTMSRGRVINMLEKAVRAGEAAEDGLVLSVFWTEHTGQWAKGGIQIAMNLKVEEGGLTYARLGKDASGGVQISMSSKLYRFSMDSGGSTVINLARTSPEIMFGGPKLAINTTHPNAVIVGWPDACNQLSSLIYNFCKPIRPFLDEQISPEEKVNKAKQVSLQLLEERITGLSGQIIDYALQKQEMEK